MTTTKLDAALEVIENAGPPQSQPEWRKLSTMLRTARAASRTERRACTPRVECGGSHRYLACWTFSPLTSCYNRGGVCGDLGMIGFARQQYEAGVYREHRMGEARAWAAASRKAGPVPLPDLSAERRKQ